MSNTTCVDEQNDWVKYDLKAWEIGSAKIGGSKRVMFVLNTLSGILRACWNNASLIHLWVVDVQEVVSIDHHFVKSAQNDVGHFSVWNICSTRPICFGRLGLRRKDKVFVHIRYTVILSRDQRKNRSLCSWEGAFMMWGMWDDVWMTFGRHFGLFANVCCVKLRRRRLNGMNILGQWRWNRVLKIRKWVGHSPFTSKQTVTRSNRRLMNWRWSVPQKFGVFVLFRRMNSYPLLGDSSINLYYPPEH